jgi:hypothetical protein
MKSGLLLLLCAFALIGCGPKLPDGYSINYGDRGKAWLEDPEGSLVHPGIIDQILIGNRQILLIAFVAGLDGEVEGPRPLDGNCYVALLVDTDRKQVRQIRLSEAERLASGMTSIESYNRKCLRGMPTS